MKTILSTWEPRICVLGIPMETDDLSVTLTINYSIPALNNEIDSFVFKVDK
jgi:hypothetical protein